MAGEVDLGHPIGRKGIDIALGREAGVAGADMDVVDVEQQGAAGAARDLGEELDLAPLVAVDRQVVRRVLQRRSVRPSASCTCGDVGADRGQRFAAARKGQQVGQVVRAAPRPGEMLGDQRRLDPPHQRGQAGQRLRIRRLGAGERQRDAVQRQRMDAADRFQPGQPRPAGDQVVLGMDLEPQARRPAGERLLEVVGLEAEPGRQGVHAAPRRARAASGLGRERAVALGRLHRRCRCPWGRSSRHCPGSRPSMCRRRWCRRRRRSRSCRRGRRRSTSRSRRRPCRPASCRRRRGLGWRGRQGPRRRGRASEHSSVNSGRVSGSPDCSSTAAGRRSVVRSADGAKRDHASAVVTGGRRVADPGRLARERATLRAMSEIELKFGVLPARAGAIDTALRRAQARRLAIESRYFDTPDRRLADGRAVAAPATQLRDLGADAQGARRRPRRAPRGNRSPAGPLGPRGAADRSVAARRHGGGQAAARGHGRRRRGAGRARAGARQHGRCAAASRSTPTAAGSRWPSTAARSTPPPPWRRCARSSTSSRAATRARSSPSARTAFASTGCG